MEKRPPPSCFLQVLERKVPPLRPANCAASGRDDSKSEERGSGRDEGEFDAAADGVDAFGTDADAIAEFPGELESRFAACGAAASAGVATGDSHDGVGPFAIDAPGVRGLPHPRDGPK